MAISTIGANSLAQSRIITAVQQPAGCILQVVQALKTDSMATSAGAVWGNVPGQGGVGTFSATITPTSASSKILITVDMKGAGAQDVTVIRSRLLRNGSPIYTGDASGSSALGMGQFYIASGGGGGGFYLAQLGGTYLDSPASTSAVTYSVQFGGDTNSSVVYINRTQGNRGGAYNDVLCASSITLMEVAA